MDKFIKLLLLSSFLFFFSVSSSQNLFGQKTIVSEGASLNIEDDIFGGNYEYVSGGTILSDRIISDAADVSYKARDLIKLTTGFKVEKNCHFKGQIVNHKVILEKSTKDPELNPFEVYPNVSKGIINIVLNAYDEKSALNIYNTSGILIYSSNQLKSGVTEINLSAQPKGVYFLKVDVNNGSYMEKIVIQ